MAAPAETRSKKDVIALMRRIGMPPETITKAQETLPDTIDLKRDGNKLAALGMTVDGIWNALGGEY
jgi:hypothetical protein